MLILEPDHPKVKEMGMFYFDSYPYSEGYVEDWDSFFDWWFSDMEAKAETRPEYVNGTYSRQIKIDVEWVIEAACEELHAYAAETISQEDIYELQAFLDQWCARQIETQTYYKDPNCLVRIHWEDYTE
jgi:hypothetical protein